MVITFLAISRYSGFNRPEQAKFERQLNPKFQSDFILPDNASLWDELVSGLKAAFNVWIIMLSIAIKNLKFINLFILG